MLRVEGMKIRYGAVEAVHGVDLWVSKGELVTLIGANGAGKSSILAGISGHVPPSEGKVSLFGDPVTGRSADAVARMGVALTPEGRRIFAHLTVSENLHLGGAAFASGEELAARREAMLVRFPILAERIDQKAGSLSGGEQQMLAIARSLMSQPRLLLLDEPSLGLAPQTIDKVYDLVEELQREGLTILLVEQNVELALSVADRGYVIANGRIALSGTASELAGSDLVRQAYLAI
ncbi:ABC transporter ATP-binding protein [Phyllobacterium zundukense]|uniref:ABC transporter ATP-binding protein n=1 Tax=Phyllobacterium zundukense TaxID=1867719 RepID=A0A2N9W1A1_9HYPH|nr:ABC transporter ATP-binding protein [Phyllobacterium zundukense]ATU95381.1 ABC transporter ATP-binding protein [Phyllobacterium zundukense]PIO45519.1 ABC transporter ATP-binding protein [Phyllobacterium zundukense]